MEESSKLIEIAIGVIVFVVAISTAVVLYSKVNNSINRVLTINENKSTTIITAQAIEEAIPIYSEAETYFMIQDMIRKIDENNSQYIEDKYVAYDKNSITSIIILKDNVEKKYNSGVTGTKSAIEYFIDDMKTNFNYYFKGKNVKIEYTYSYQPLERLNIANHKITSIKFIVI